MSLRFNIISLVVLSGMLSPLAGCGSKNIADCDGGMSGVPCSEKTPEEQAQIYLDQSDFASTVTYLEQVMVDEPTRYSSFPYLAAAYGGLAGFDIFKALTSATSTSLMLEGGFLDAVGSFIPKISVVGESGYAARVTYMTKAVDRLEAMPADYRTSTSSVTYIKSAAFMLPIYQMSETAMMLEQFNSAATGDIDPAKLATMTEAEAEAILNNLSAAAAAASQGQDAETQASINEAVAAIQASPGATNKEKLQSYMQTQ